MPRILYHYFQFDDLVVVVGDFFQDHGRADRKAHKFVLLSCENSQPNFGFELELKPHFSFTVELKL